MYICSLSECILLELGGISKAVNTITIRKIKQMYQYCNYDDSEENGNKLCGK